jgi:hypothetical protein
MVSTAAAVSASPAIPAVIGTLDRYSHVIPTIQREAARVMDELLAAAPR